VELLTGGASPKDELPLIVAIHGLGDNPNAFSGIMRGFSGQARVLAPAGPTPYGGGFSWFPYRPGRTDAELSAGIHAAADRVAQFLRWAAQARPTSGRPIVTGFSQGGMLSFALAVEHPELVAGAYPMGGMLPRGLWPDAKASFPPIVAFHGDADPIVSFDADRETVERLRQLGAHAELRTYDGVRHAVPPPMRRDLFAALGEAVSRIRP
jgi:phospholipase/carboxylesterase